MSVAERFAKLPTAAKLLLILTAVLLPIGIALTWIGQRGIQQANGALEGRARDQAQAAAHAIESLIARNALALRIAAAGALRSPGANPCEEAAEALTTAPAISRRFSLRSLDGDLICTSGGFNAEDPTPLVVPGAIRIWIDPNQTEVDLRVGIAGGIATSNVPQEELRSAATDMLGPIQHMSLRDGSRVIPLVGGASAATDPLSYTEWPIGNGALVARIGSPRLQITTVDRLMLLLPVLMWVAAALITWVLVSRLLIRPLKKLERAVLDYQPGTGELVLPRKAGPATEIQELRDAFARAVARVDESEQEMSSALEGQRRLVREVHHRVKNNLQVVASLLNIHGRSAETAEAQRGLCGDQSSRGRPLDRPPRPLCGDGGKSRDRAAPSPHANSPRSFARAHLRSPAASGSISNWSPSTRRRTSRSRLHFLITRSSNSQCSATRTIRLRSRSRRTSELTARLTLDNHVLVPDEADQPEKIQFERIVAVSPSTAFNFGAEARPIQRRFACFSAS